MDSFNQVLKENQEKLLAIASKAVKEAKNLGADECEVSIGGVKGLSVSSRDKDVENIEFNNDNGMEIVIYKDKKRGNASTTDLSENAIYECIQSAVNIAKYSSQDDCAGLCDPDLMCTTFKNLKLVFENKITADEAIKQAIELEEIALDRNVSGIKKSDGASFDASFYTSVLANSLGFCHAKSSSYTSKSLILLGEHDGKMQRGNGYSVARDLNDLYDNQKVVDEAIEKTVRKLNAHSVPTGKYNIIFAKSAACTLWGALSSGISGGALYRRSSFLCDKLGEKIFPEFVSIHEDPFILKGLASRNYDADGVAVKPSNIIEDGVLQSYLLATYSSRKLKLKSNGHASGIHNWMISFDKEHTFEFDDLLKNVGEGIVVTELMGQGIDMVSGNYSRGAEGYYFKNGKFEHAVEGITIAGNLKDMFANMSAISTDVDERLKIKSGSVLIPNMTVSGI